MEAHFHVSHDSDDEAPCKEKKDDVDNPEIADFEKAISLTGYGKYNYLLLLTAMIGTIGHQCDLNGVSFLLPSAECDLHLTQRDKGLLNAVIYIGMISSAFMWGFLSDTFGRRIPITVAYFIDAILNICSSFAQSFWVLLVIKFCTGFVICGPVSMVKAYLAEFHGQSSRAKVMMCTGVFASSANVIIPGLAWIIIPQPWSWELFGGYIVYNSWRVYVLVCAMPSLLAAFLMTFFLESPKFLMAVGRNEQAIDVLRSVYRINTGRDAQTYPIKVLIHRKMSIIEETPSKMIANKSILSVLKQGFAKIKPLFKLPLLPKILLVFIIQFGTLFGLSTLRQWLPQIFATMQEYTHIQESMNVSIVGVSLCDMLEYTRFQNTTEVRLEGTGHCSVTMVRVARRPCGIHWRNPRYHTSSVLNTHAVKQLEMN
uniref:Major facilitator superfamily (MFS) profile domain-containing protein n=2 Tax=Timema TaxID=61471 RepID=A0A7R9I1C4_9NEOP|nr:unnamed protein product [Timema bartmani]